MISISWKALEENVRLISSYCELVEIILNKDVDGRQGKKSN